MERLGINNYQAHGLNKSKFKLNPLIMFKKLSPKTTVLRRYKKA